MSGLTAPLARLRQTSRARWQAMAARERRMVSIAAAVVAVALLWLWAIQPAWQMRQRYETDRTAMERQVQQMQVMRQQALQLQRQLQGSATTSVAPDKTASEVQAAALRLLGAGAQTVVVGERATVRFQDAPADGLVQWLRETRESTRSQPVQVELTRGEGTPTIWSGQIVLAVPPAAQP